jgi:hypothetical protein
VLFWSSCASAWLDIRPPGVAVDATLTTMLIVTG